MDSNYSNVRLQPSSSELVALSTLTPPSPVLSPSLLSTSVTSGYIPILLDGLDFPRFSTATTFGERRASARTSLCDSYLPRSNSSASIGTFGPVYKAPCLVHRESICSLPNEDAIHKTTEVSSCSHPHSRLPESVESNIECFNSAVPVRSTNNREAGGRQVGIGCETAWQFSGAGTGTRTREVLLPPGIGLGVGLPAYSHKRDQPCEPSTSLSDGLKSVAEFALKPLVQPKSSRVKDMPFSWLDKIRVVLSIDQEGFRSISPSFRFVGCTSKTIDHKKRTIVAQFVPVNQKIFHFHYTPFDSLPVLRRVSVNDDENRDYISREATLGLKSNSVYAVYGVESMTRPAHDENRGQHGTTELYWEFLYKVEDRRIGPTRKLIDGEKNFTPLSFSCSPALLHSHQGKKVNLMQVVKKSITGRLAAEKLQPSELDPKPRKHLVSSSRLPLHDATNLTSNLHRRAVSHGRHQVFSPASAGTKYLPREIIFQDGQSNGHGQDATQSARRRRASSAGEWKGDSKHLAEGKASTLLESHPIQRHIVDPSRLAEMLETNESGRDVDFCPLSPDPHHYRSRRRIGA